MFMWFDLLMTKMFSYASGCKPTWNCGMGFLNAGNNTNVRHSDMSDIPIGMSGKVHQLADFLSDKLQGCTQVPLGERTSHFWRMKIISNKINLLLRFLRLSAEIRITSRESLRYGVPNRSSPPFAWVVQLAHIACLASLSSSLEFRPLLELWV